MMKRVSMMMRKKKEKKMLKIRKQSKVSSLQILSKSKKQ
jgi:hypothetical protein